MKEAPRNPLLQKPKGPCVYWNGAGSSPTIKRTQKCGLIRRYDKYRGKVVSKTPARYFYEQKHGVLRSGLEVFHICGESLCINVDHLIAGTRAILYKWAHEAGRMHKPPQKTHCKQGHPLSGDNLYEHTSPTTGKTRRMCRECRNKKTREKLRKKNGWSPRKEREHPPMHNAKEYCRSGKHRFTKENTLVYFNKTDGRWNRLCRKCANKRLRINWRQKKGQGKTIAKYREEWDESYAPDEPFEEPGLRTVE